MWLIGPGTFNPCTILVLEEHRENCLWKPPSGSVEQGETPLVAAIRETEEETGIVLVPQQAVLLEERTKHARGYHIFYYVARVSGRQMRQLRRRGKTGERTLRYPLRRLPYQLDEGLGPFETPLLRGKGILRDDLEFLKRVANGEVISPIESGYRYLPKWQAA